MTVSRLSTYKIIRAAKQNSTIELLQEFTFKITADNHKQD